eukprot:jgi/Antlo1/1317/32
MSTIRKHKNTVRHGDEQIKDFLHLSYSSASHQHNQSTCVQRETDS